MSSAIMRRVIVVTQLSEQSRYEFMKVIPPIDPTVAARALLERRREAVLLEHIDRSLAVTDKGIAGTGAEPDCLEAFLDLGIIEYRSMVLLPIVQTSDENPRTEHTNTAKPIEIGKRDVQS